LNLNSKVGLSHQGSAGGDDGVDLLSLALTEQQNFLSSGEEKNFLPSPLPQKNT
jgi:hypothetical protein